MSVSRICQSCAMPLVNKTEFAIEQDGTLNEDYCCYCYKEGAFTQALSMDEMINHCLKLLDEFNSGATEKITQEQAIKQMQALFPQLKRWQKAGV